MSTSTLLRSEGTAWMVAKDVKQAIGRLKTSDGIVTKLGLDYTVSAHNMKTDIDEPVPGYWAIYRDDSNKFLGPVKCDTPDLIQNVDSFRSIEPMLREGILKPECADTYMGGKQIFGCFKFNDPFKVVDDEFNQYFIIVNNHLKPNGKVDVISSPVRIACMNALGSALQKSTMKFQIPALVDENLLPNITETILNAYTRTVEGMNKSAQNMLDIKINDSGIQKILDELFPYVDAESETSNHDRANMAVEAQREAFIICLNADNLNNYKGTAYQVYNALTDYSQHVYSNSDKAYNLESRMTLIPGMNPEATTNNLKVAKFLKNMDKFAIAA